MPVDRSQAVRVEGLADFQKELRALDRTLPRELGQANKRAAEMVAERARQRAQSLGSVAAKSAPSIKAAAEQRRSKINLGSTREPWALGAEFGGQGRPTTQQFEPHRGREGYFLYPTIRDTRDEYLEIYGRILEQLMRAAFPN